MDESKGGFVDRERVWNHLNWLTTQTPERYTGTEQGQAAAAYVVEELKKAGVDEAMVENYPGYGSTIKPGSVEITSPEAVVFVSETIGYSQATPSGGLPFQLVDVGAGWESDWQAADVNGHVALCNAWEGPATPEKARLAEKYSARGFIMITGPSPEPETRAFRAIKGVWGPPDTQTIGTIPAVAAATVTYDDGLQLRGLLRQGRVRGRLNTYAERRWVTLNQPVGVLRAAKPTEDFVLIGGHLDVWKPGVTDNGSGVALLLELAREMAKQRNGLTRNIIFAFWDGHEILEAYGSSSFVQRHWDAVRDHGLAQLNVDSPGLIGSDRYLTFASYEMRDFISGLHQAVKLNPPSAIANLPRAYDQSFTAAGLPGFYSIEWGPDQPRGEQVDSFLWWAHTVHDTLDKFDMAKFEGTASLYKAYLQALTMSPAIPFTLAPLAAAVEAAVSKCLADWPGSGNWLELKGLGSQIAEFKQLAAAFDEKTQTLRRDGDAATLATYRRLSQVLAPTVYTTVDRYRQDRYGDLRYQNSLPILAPWREIAGKRENSEDFYLLLTEAVRVRNQLADALATAVAVLRG